MAEFSAEELIRFVESDDWEFKEEDPATGIKMYEIYYASPLFNGIYNNTAQKAEVSYQLMRLSVTSKTGKLFV